MNDKIRILNTKDKDKMRTSIEIMKRQLPMFIEHTTLIAKIRKAGYDAYIREDFSPDQALELCKTTTL